LSSVIVVGTQWGDEGKGKIVDLYAETPTPSCASRAETMQGTRSWSRGSRPSCILIPSGVLHDYKTCIPGQRHGHSTPKVLIEEIQYLKKENAFPPNTKLVISDKAHVIMP